MRHLGVVIVHMYYRSSLVHLRPSHPSLTFVFRNRQPSGNWVEHLDPEWYMGSSVSTLSPSVLPRSDWLRETPHFPFSQKIRANCKIHCK
jgi:hypothetical protein